jgi:hypothetical protein
MGARAADALGGAAGIWGRGAARAVFMRRTVGNAYEIGLLGEQPWTDPDDPPLAAGLWIVAYEHGESYRLAERGAAAHLHLLDLAALPAGEEATARAVARWVADYGAPTGPDDWLDGAYIDWCDEQRLIESADFARWWAARDVWPEVDRLQYRPSTPLVPVDYVRWLAARLTAFRRAQMDDRSLAEDPDLWLWADRRMAQLEPHIRATGGRIMLVPRTLEAHLTARAMLDVHGGEDGRFCRECGDLFVVTDGRQVFCCPAHQQRFNARRRRRRASGGTAGRP